MHLEMTNKICVLCKRMVAADGHPDSARLCEECRSLIQTILPKAGSNSFSEFEQARAYAQTQPHLARAGAAQPALAATASLEEDLGDVEIISRSGHPEAGSFDPVADFDEVQPGHVTAIETEYLDEFESGDFDANDEVAYTPVEALLDPVDESIPETSEPAAQELEVFLMPAQAEDFHNDATAFEAERFEAAQAEAAPSEKPHTPDLSGDEEPDRIISLPHSAEANTLADFKVETSMNGGAAKDAEATGGAEETSYQEAVDPWDDPLPAWDRSRNEYPLYVGVAERKRRSRLKSLLVPAFVLVCLVVAYLIFQSRDSAPQNQQAAEGSAQGNLASSLPVAAPQESDSSKPASDDDKQAASDSTGSSEAQPAATAEKNDAPVAAATTGDGAGTEWRHALQALASPSADEASAFAGKLSSAGIPAYVIPADIANRGRWFRVRIGGFNTAQEAQKFAAEARQRAKAAGVTLKDLNVVDYVKP